MIYPIEASSSVLHYADLEKQIWREIFTLTDLRIIKEKLKADAKIQNQSLSDSFATQKAKDIQYCIRQAYDYFSSSKSATIVIKPTLIYYGLISLATALIIYKYRDKSLHSMKEAHGLKDKYSDKLKSIGNDISRDEILQISTEIQGSGTFVEISRLSLSEYFILPVKHDDRADTSKDYLQSVNLSQEYPNLKEINLLTLFQNIPEIWKETKLFLKKASFVYEGEAVLHNSRITCRISKELTPINELKRNLAFTEKADFSESNNYYFFSLSRTDYTGCTPLTKRNIMGNQFLVADKNNSLITSDFILYYLTFFILGSLARYKPVLWRTMLEDSLQGLNTIPEILCDSAYIKLPLAFLTEYTKKLYKL